MAAAYSAARRQESESFVLAQSEDYRKRYQKSVLKNPLYSNKNFRLNPWELISRSVFFIIMKGYKYFRFTNLANCNL